MLRNLNKTIGNSFSKSRLEPSALLIATRLCCLFKGLARPFLLQCQRSHQRDSREELEFFVIQNLRNALSQSEGAKTA